MRINKYIAHATRLSRRAADTAIEEGRVTVNGHAPSEGMQITAGDIVSLDGRPVIPNSTNITIALHKPSGYVCSRDGQGSLTIYDLLPEKYQHLNSIGRLDRESSGLILLTNDGQLAQKLSHPSNQKAKVYELTLDRELTETDRRTITTQGVQLRDGISKFDLAPRGKNAIRWTATLREGRNRQIRYTFEALGYKVINLHRIQFGDYPIGTLSLGELKVVDSPSINAEEK